MDTSLLDAIAISIFSIVVVFITLYVISLLIKALEVVNRLGKTKEAEDQLAPPHNLDPPKEEEVLDPEDNKVLVAVITGAIMASRGQDLPSIRIKRIKRRGLEEDNWTRSGLNESIENKL